MNLKTPEQMEEWFNSFLLKEAEELDSTQELVIYLGYIYHASDKEPIQPPFIEGIHHLNLWN